MTSQEDLPPGVIIDTPDFIIRFYNVMYSQGVINGCYTGLIICQYTVCRRLVVRWAISATAELLVQLMLSASVSLPLKG